MNVVVFGCGRTGSTVAQLLASDGHKVTVIEQNPASLKRLGRDHHCTVIIGSGLDADILERAEIRNADVFFALTRGDNTNLMAAQIAKIRYGCKQVCVKVADPLRAKAYKDLGYLCINPASLTAGMMVDWFLGKEYRTVTEYNDIIKGLEG